MSWHTWSFGREKSARTPCSGSRRSRWRRWMVFGTFSSIQPRLPKLREQHFLISDSYGQFLFWLLLHHHPRHLCQWEQRPHTPPLLSEMIWTWREDYRLGDIFSFIQRFWCLSYSLGHSYHLFLQIMKRTHSFAGMKAGLYIQSIRVKISGLERIIATQACVLVWLLLTSGKFLFPMSPVDSSEMFSFCVKWRVGLSWEACDDKGEVMKWLCLSSFTNSNWREIYDEVWRGDPCGQETLLHLVDGSKQLLTI